MKCVAFSLFALLLVVAADAQTSQQPVSAAANGSCPDPKSLDRNKPEVPLCLVANEMAQALDQYNSDPGSANLPKLSKVNFDFKTQISTTVGAKISFLIFKFGGSREKDVTNEVSFAYQVPGPNQALIAKKSTKLATTLIELLRAAATQIAQTPSVGQAKFNSLTVTLAYGVKWDASAEGDPVVNIVTVTLSGDRNRNDIQTLTVTFGPS